VTKRLGFLWTARHELYSQEEATFINTLSRGLEIEHNMETPHGSSIQWYAYEPSFDVFSFVYDLHVFFYLHDIQ